MCARRETDGHVYFPADGARIDSSSFCCGISGQASGSSSSMSPFARKRHHDDVVRVAGEKIAVSRPDLVQYAERGNAVKTRR